MKMPSLAFSLFEVFAWQKLLNLMGGIVPPEPKGKQRSARLRRTIGSKVGGSA